MSGLRRLASHGWGRRSPLFLAVLLAVAAALLLLPLAPGHAQTTTYTYVSNIDQGDDDDTSGTEVTGQRFTTGSQSGGYDVTSVDIGYDDAQGDKYSAAIYTVDADGYPDSEVFALTAPTGAWAAGTTLSFTAPANSTLAASTTYTVRMVPTGAALRHDTTTSSDEDSGVFSGWSIQDAFDVRISSGWIHSTSGEIIRIAIKGSTTAPAANNPATGAPTISGTAQVGQTLTAATSGIMDADSLNNVAYTYQWIRVDGGTEADISGATSSTYTLVAADQGKTIKVKVSFTDDASNAETLTSTATAAVTAAQDETVAWNATLTSADNWALGSTYTYDGYGSSALGSITTTQGSLSPDSFTVGGTTHTVELLGVREGTDNRLYLITDTAVSKSDLAGYAMEFTVDGSTTTLKVSDAIDQSNLGFYWADSRHSFGPDDWQAKTITVKLLLIVPGAPTGLTVTEGHHAVKLNWTAPADNGGSPITGYEVRLILGGLVVTAATGSTSTSATYRAQDDGDSPYQVRAVNANGNGPWTAAVTGTVGPATVTIAAGGGVIEGAAAAFTLTASKPVLSSLKPLNVSVSVSESEDMVASAEEGAKTVSFAEGDTTATLSVPTVDDGVVESDSVVTAAIQTNTDYTVGTDGSGTVTVADNDTTANNPATGAPTITGTAQVGQTLTAATSGIMDSDGLATPGYTYQWIRVDGGTDANISGATSITYTLVAADLGKTIKVKVSFTDDASNAETLTSAATAAVTAAVTDDCAETTTTTCSVSLGSSVNGDIESNNDADYFSLALTSGVTYQIDAEGSDTSKGTLDDPFLYLRNASGTELASNEDGGTGRNARIVWTATSTETGYVDVQDSSATNTGTYTLTVSVATVPDAIADLSARPGNTQVTLSWTAFDDGGSTITKFEYRQKTSGSYGSWMDISNSPSTVSHTVTGLTNATAYTFQVRAMNGVGNAGVSNEATATPGYAQSAANVTYVSNIGQGSDDDYSSSNVRAQTFTTGSRAGGYTVTSVDIGSDDAQGDSFTVNISITDPTSGNPVAKVATLTVPTSFTAGTLTFIAPPTPSSSPTRPMP